MTGTVRYCSLNAQLGHEQSRRDDIEAIGYMLCYFLRNGKLPWKGVPCKNKKERAAILCQIKKDSRFEDLFSGHPQEFVTYMNYARNLGFDERPDYAYLRQLFMDVMLKNSYDYDFEYDWIIKR